MNGDNAKIFLALDEPKNSKSHFIVVGTLTTVFLIGVFVLLFIYEKHQSQRAIEAQPSKQLTQTPSKKSKTPTDGFEGVRNGDISQINLALALACTPENSESSIPFVPFQCQRIDGKLTALGIFNCAVKRKTFSGIFFSSAALGEILNLGAPIDSASIRIRCGFESTSITLPLQECKKLAISREQKTINPDMITEFFKRCNISEVEKLFPPHAFDRTKLDINKRLKASLQKTPPRDSENESWTFSHDRYNDPSHIFTFTIYKSNDKPSIVFERWKERLRGIISIEDINAAQAALFYAGNKDYRIQFKTRTAEFPGPRFYTKVAFYDDYINIELQCLDDDDPEFRTLSGNN